MTHAAPDPSTKMSAVGPMPPSYGQTAMDAIIAAKVTAASTMNRMERL